MSKAEKYVGRYINVAAINAEGAPISTQLWDETADGYARAFELLQSWADRFVREGHPLVTAVIYDQTAHPVLQVRRFDITGTTVTLR